MFSESEGGFLGIVEAMAPFARSRDSDISNDVYRGLVALPGLTKRAPCFVKVFPESICHLRVFNEVLSHRVAACCEIPSPFTFAVAVPKAHFSNGSRVIATYKNCERQYVLGVASLAVDNQTFAQIVKPSDVISDLLSWRYLSQAACFDEILGNGDRHLGNILRCAANEYVLIDQERMVFEKNWIKDGCSDVLDLQCESNLFAATIAECPDELMRRRMIENGKYYMERVNIEPDSKILKLATMLGVESRVTEFFDFVNYRVQHLPGSMQWHLQRGAIFRSSTA